MFVDISILYEESQIILSENNATIFFSLNKNRMDKSTNCFSRSISEVFIGNFIILFTQKNTTAKKWNCKLRNYWKTEYAYKYEVQWEHSIWSVCCNRRAEQDMQDMVNLKWGNLTEWLYHRHSNPAFEIWRRQKLLSDTLHYIWQLI